MIKKYYCANELSFNIKVNGRKKHIIFNPLSAGGAVYITDNLQEQISIEKVTGFGSLFKLIECSEESESIENMSVVIDIPEIENCADAKIWLRERGVKGSLNSRIAINQAALSLGYSFSNL
ncbi:MAG: hypothetical protein R3Y22_04590 [Bacteroidales bacterium]